ncbi:MAG: DUF547 domain-containing protein [Pseudomonadota bacterium]
MAATSLRLSRREAALGFASMAAVGCAAGAGDAGDGQGMASAASGGNAGAPATSSPTILPSDYFETVAGPFPQFATAPAAPKYGFGFDAIDALIRRYVLDLGPSDRVAPAAPIPRTGSRIQKGHSSDYRLEGSRVPFALFEEADVAAWASARRSLEALGNQRPLSEYRWLDQMAFWLNLHNVALIEQLAVRYPVRFPYDLKIDGAPFYDAKIVEIHGERLSLRDIRIEIVYRHWREPASIYGFFHGVVGGPALKSGAFTAEGLAGQLADAGREFVNSLRGLRAGARSLRVSKIYAEAAPLFPQFDADLRRHLSSYADDHASELLASGQPLRVSQYDPKIADLSGGDVSTPTTPMSASTAIIAGGGAAGSAFANGLAQFAQESALAELSRLPPHAAEFVRDYQVKLRRRNQRLRRERRRPSVTIKDLPGETVE